MIEKERTKIDLFETNRSDLLYIEQNREITISIKVERYTEQMRIMKLRQWMRKTIVEKDQKESFRAKL